jgi:hypothetical protein
MSAPGQSRRFALPAIPSGLLPTPDNQLPTSSAGFSGLSKGATQENLAADNISSLGRQTVPPLYPAMAFSSFADIQ